MKARPLINAGTSIKLREPGAFIMFIENLDQIDKVSFSSAFVRASSFSSRKYYNEEQASPHERTCLQKLSFESEKLRISSTHKYHTTLHYPWSYALRMSRSGLRNTMLKIWLEMY